MATYIRTIVQEADEDDLGREWRVYDAKKTDGTTVARMSLVLPGVDRFDGPVVDLLPLAADRTSLRALLVKAARCHLANQGMTVKP